MAEPLQLSSRLPVSEPDLGQLQSVITSLALAKWHDYIPPDSGLPGSPGRGRAIRMVEVRSLRRADELLTNHRSGPDLIQASKEDRIFMVDVLVHVDWWKLSTQHVLVLRSSPGRLEPLFHYCGGTNGRGVDAAVINLGVDEERYALMIQDRASGNQSSQTRTRIVLYEPVRGRFAEVFNELTTRYDGMCEGVSYDGTLLLEPMERDLRDVVINARFWRGRRRVHRRVAFAWNGSRYVGEMPDPDQVVP